MYVNKITLVTDVMPENCAECEGAVYMCRLPFKKYPKDEELLKKYLKNAMKIAH